MLILYAKRGCPYCNLVLDTAKELGLSFTLKNIDEPGVADELVARGGKRQMPYLVDDAHGVEMYESEDIDRYLREHYSVPA